MVTNRKKGPTSTTSATQKELATKTLMKHSYYEVLGNLAKSLQTRLLDSHNPIGAARNIDKQKQSLWNGGKYSGHAISYIQISHM